MKFCRLDLGFLYDSTGSLGSRPVELILLCLLIKVRGELKALGGLGVACRLRVLDRLGYLLQSGLVSCPVPSNV
jgi:hypothetical protein